MKAAKTNNLLVLLEVMKSKVDFLSSADNTVDGKAGTLLGFEITLGIGYLSFIVGSLQGIRLWGGIFGLILLGISIVLLLVITWPRDYNTYISLDDHKDYLARPEKDLLLQLISDTQHTFMHNKRKLKTKTRLYKCAVTLLIVSSSLFVLSTIGKTYV